MSDFKANVKIGAEIGGLKTGMDEASNAVKKLGDNIGSSMGGVNNSVKGASESFNSLGTAMKTSIVYGGVYKALEAIKSGMSAISIGAIDVASSFEDMQIGLAAIIASSHENTTVEGEAISSAQKYAWAKEQAAEAIQKLRKANLETPATLGQLTDAFQTALVPAQKFGLSMDQTVQYSTAMTQAAFAMRVPMDQLAQEMRAVFEGDTSKNSRINSILQIKTDALEAHKAAGDLFPFLMEKLADYRQAGQDISHSWSGIKSNIADAFQTLQAEIAKNLLGELEKQGLKLQDTLTKSAKSIGRDVGGAFKDIYIVGKQIFEGLKEPVKQMWKSISEVKDIIKVLWATLSEKTGVNTFVMGVSVMASGVAVAANGILELIDGLGILALKIKSLFLDSGSVAYKEAQKAQDKLREHIVGLDKNNKDVVKALAETYGRLSAAKPKEIEEKESSGGGSANTPKTKQSEETDSEKTAREKRERAAKKAASDAQKLADKIKQINDEAVAMRLEGFAREEAEARKSYDKQMEDFKLSSEGRLAAQNLLNAKLADIDKRREESALALNRKIASDSAKAKIDSLNSSAMAEMQIVQDNISTLRELGKISDLEALEATKKLEEAKYQVALKTAQDKAALIVGEGSEYKNAMTQIEAMSDVHRVKMNAITNNIAVAQSKTFEGMMTSISDSIGGALGNLINFTTTWKSAFNSILTSMLGTFTQFIGKRVVAWVAGEKVMTAGTIAGNVTRVASDIWANGVSLAVTIASSLKKIAIYAWEAAAGAFAAIAAIPYVGPFLAPAAAAGAVVAVMAMAGNISSAEGGFDIPNGVNPMTQLHQNEMVLPAEHANTIRSLGAGGAGGGTNITIHAVDAKGVKELFMNHGNTLVDALQKTRRNFKV